MRFLAATAALLICAASPALAKECRMPDLPPGVQVQVPSECRDRLLDRRAQAERQDSLKASPGFIDLGNGTQVRIGGRVRAEGMVRR
ncbi:hypothetical protein [Microvirga lotononidis]|uniref:Uncharacterized protein n=1 Tax=Microvirga lotononidis TaxID=864069 RepID=I4YL99_9HYPH|nr:hypothetical protein [Microvirga lotononidis]EIM24741.1 hypothetical protein MicloDRAFT_00054600 [Microvirga lotononidis]WQO26748.1 hypothetical protein U0023_19085 [Microvirga lotononidis]